MKYSIKYRDDNVENHAKKKTKRILHFNNDGDPFFLNKSYHQIIEYEIRMMAKGDEDVMASTGVLDGLSYHAYRIGKYINCIVGFIG